MVVELITKCDPNIFMCQQERIKSQLKIGKKTGRQTVNESEEG